MTAEDPDRMITQCPQCETCFRVTEAQLSVAGGLVRCCQCQQVFNAADNLETPLPEPTPLDGVNAIDEPSPPPPARTRLYIEDPSVNGSTDSHFAERGNRRALYTLPADPQDIFTGKRKRDSGSGWGWTLASLLLVGVLVVQAAWWFRDQAVWYGEGRFVLEKVCAVAGCEVPSRRAPALIRILERDIRSDPGQSNALHLELTMSNTAAHEQPYPEIQLSLYDNHEKLVAQRRFNPREYLSAEQQTAQSMPVDLPVRVEMNLLDPGSDVTGFRFDFL